MKEHEKYYCHENIRNDIKGCRSFSPTIKKNTFTAPASALPLSKNFHKRLLPILYLLILHKSQ